MAQCIFYNGIGNIPAKVLANFIYDYEDKIVRVTADTEWDDGSAPQIRFELDVSREDADNVVNRLNAEMDEASLSDGWYLADD